MTRAPYRVVFERDDDGAWLARVPSVRGCHTYGRTIDQARRRIREALSLWIDGADDVELVEDVRLPARAKAAVARSRTQRGRAATQQRAARAATLEAARALVDDAGLGLRDTADLLGISHQRVQQLLRGTG